MSEICTDITLGPAAAQALLARWLGHPVVCTAVDALDGGMINSVLCLEFDCPPWRAVVKLAEPSRHGDLVAEKRRLDYLRAQTGLRCPEPYLAGVADGDVPWAFLLMEALPGVHLGQARLSPRDRVVIDGQLADALLELHSHSRDTFGGIDEIPGETRWSAIHVPRLIEMRGEMPGKLPASVLRDIDAALEAAPEALAAQGRPTLIHGDLWAANIMVEQVDGIWQLSGFLDPGIQYADVEHELAYLDVFSTAGPAFFAAYTAVRPMRPGYEFRRLFYWLATYMIHVWLFGDQHYRDRAAWVASEIVRALPARDRDGNTC